MLTTNNTSLILPSFFTTVRPYCTTVLFFKVTLKLNYASAVEVIIKMIVFFKSYNGTKNNSLGSIPQKIKYILVLAPLAIYYFISESLFYIKKFY